MNLKTIIQSEVNQKEKKYRILTHIYGIYKVSTDETLCRAAMEMQTQTTQLEERVQQIESRMYMETYTLSYVKQVAMEMYYMIQGAQTGAL